MELDNFKDVNLVIDKANDVFIQKQFVSNGDIDGRTLTVQLTNDGEIGASKNTQVNLRWNNLANGITDLSAFELIDASKSIYRIEYPKNMLTPGDVRANIQIIQDEKVTHLRTFTISVQRLAGSDKGFVENAQYSALVQTLADANKFRTDIDIQNDTIVEVTRNVDQAINEVQDQKKDLGIQKQRIDELTTLPPGSTVANAELVDVRASVTGANYPNAGEAVRGQVSTIDSKIKSVLNVNSNLAVSWNQGGLTIDDVAEVDSSKRLRSVLLEAHQGTTITCTNKQYCFIVYLFDKNKKYKKPLSSDLVANAHRYTFVVPEGVYFLRLVISSSQLLENNDSVNIGLDAAESIVIDQVINQESTTGFETAEFVFGAIDNGGNLISMQNRLRSVFVRAKKGDRIRLTEKLKYEYRVIEYLSNVNQSFLVASDTTFHVEDYIVKNDRCAFVRVILKRVDDADFENVDAGSRILLQKSDVIHEKLILPTYVPQTSFSTESLYYDERSAPTYAKIIENYDALVSKNPEYVKKTLLGKDQSSTHDIYCYEFKAKQLGISGNPLGTSYSPNMIPTIILDGGLHVFEKPIVLAILNAMQKITEDWLGDEILTWLRFNFRILVIPVSNPWGYVNEKRTNSRQVDLNRNFDVLNYWEKGDNNTSDDRYRGETPLSEVESQYINQLLKLNKETAWLYLNFHTYGMGTSYQTMTSYEVMPIIPTDKIVLSLIELIKITTQSAWKNHGLPLNSGYIGGVSSDELGAMAAGQANIYGIPSAIPEGMYKFFGQNNNWSTEVNCLNTEIVINSILIPIRKLYFSN